MKLNSRDHNSRVWWKPFVLSLAFLIATVAVSVMVSATSTTAAHGANTNIVAGSILSNIVTPMDMRITGVNKAGASQASLIATLSATNDIGLNRNYANAIVTLQSLKLNVSYRYTSSSGSSEKSEGTVTLTPSFTMRTGEQKTLSVNVGPLPSSAVGIVDVQVSGRYTWILESTNTDGSQTTAYGSGRLLQLEGLVTAP